MHSRDGATGVLRPGRGRGTVLRFLAGITVVSERAVGFWFGRALEVSRAVMAVVGDVPGGGGSRSSRAKCLRGSWLRCASRGRERGSGRGRRSSGTTASVGAQTRVVDMAMPLMAWSGGEDTVLSGMCRGLNGRAKAGSCSWE